MLVLGKINLNVTIEGKDRHNEYWLLFCIELKLRKERFFLRWWALKNRSLSDQSNE